MIQLNNFKTPSFAIVPFCLAQQPNCENQLLNYVDFSAEGFRIFAPVYLSRSILPVLNLVENYFPGVFSAINFSKEHVIFYLSRRDLTLVSTFFKYS